MSKHQRSQMEISPLLIICSDHQLLSALPHKSHHIRSSNYHPHLHISCHLKQKPQYWMLRSPASAREYPSSCSSLAIKTKTISPAYTMKWQVVFQLLYRLGHRSNPCSNLHLDLLACCRLDCWSSVVWQQLFYSRAG